MNAVSCPKCGPEALTLKKPAFDGLRKTGDRIVCASCGRELGMIAAGEAPVPANPAAKPRPSIFDDVELTRADPFAREERGRLCRYCLHYIVNPFRQWCGRHRRDVEALDTCWNFERRPDEEKDPSDPSDPPAPLPGKTGRGL
ncbi:MAG: hypothetical protein U1E27_13040 [Kiritimatiellia bacterium]|nr:hypothetical protein [Kiritimatiellia bacterium]